MKKKEKSKTPNLDKMQNFKIKKMPDLDVCVLGALELFNKEGIGKIDLSKFKRPLVIGSGNAETTGKILFSGRDVVIGNENNYKDKLKKIKNIDGVVIVSASGGKHAPGMVAEAKKRRKKVLLLTNNLRSLAAKNLRKGEIEVLPKQREPYTYNTSTYLGMIIANTQEDPQRIKKFIEGRIEPIVRKVKWKKYNAFYLILPPELELMRDMLDKKFVELFGRQIPYSIYSSEYIKHATTVVPRKDELFVSFGYNNKTWGKNRVNIPLPKWGNYATLMSTSYYVMGAIQKSRKQWFKKNIGNYTNKISKIFGQEIKTVVE